MRSHLIDYASWKERLIYSQREYLTWLQSVTRNVKRYVNVLKRIVKQGHVLTFHVHVSFVLCCTFLSLKNY